MLEKLSSHRYVVENGSIVEIRLVAGIGNSLAAVNQKLSKGRSAKLNFKPRSFSVQLYPPAPAKSCPFQEQLLSYMGPKPMQCNQWRITENKTTTSAQVFSNVYLLSHTVQQC